MLQVGHKNYIKKDKIVSIAGIRNTNVMPAPIKQAIYIARKENRLIDLTAGRRTRSVIFMNSGYIVLSALESNTLTLRLDA